MTTRKVKRWQMPGEPSEYVIRLWIGNQTMDHQIGETINDNR